MKLIKRLLLLVAVLVVGALIFLNFSQSAKPFVEGSASAAMLVPGPYKPNTFNEVLIDNKRTTQKNGAAAAQNHRRLDTVVWYPVENEKVAAGRHPLVVYSHGFSANKEAGSHLGEFLSSHGYIVVMADFPLTNFETPGGPMVKDVVNQPGDVSFLIDTLLQWNNTDDHLLAGSIDEQRIAATGISLGGMTTTLAAFHPQKRDPRIKIAASIAGPLSMFGPDFFSHHSMPFMMLATDEDALVEYKANARLVLERVKGAHLVTIAGGSHTGFADTAKYFRWLDNPDSVGCEQVLKNINMEEEPWYDQLGTPAQGIIYEPPAPICTSMPLPKAMNPLRQHMITKVAIYSFFQSEFAETAEQRASFASFLSARLPQELEEVTYERAELPDAPAL